MFIVTSFKLLIIVPADRAARSAAKAKEYALLKRRNEVYHRKKKLLSSFPRDAPKS
jgi:hypothetical protein